MVEYAYLGSASPRRETVMDEIEAMISVGERVLTGFPVVQRYVTTPSGETVPITYFQSDITGEVWAVYV